MNPAKGFAKMAMFGWSIWVRLLGPKRAKYVVLVGMAVSTVVCIILQLKGV